MRYVFMALFVFNSVFADDFVVGTTSAYAPYVSLDEKGQYVGFDIDVAEALANKLDQKLVLRDLGSMPSILLALKQGKIDAAIWAISITEERQKRMEMIYYQGEKVTALPLLFWGRIPVASLSEMANNPKAVIAVEAGSFQDRFLQKVPGLTLKYVDKVMDALLEIRYGKSLATLIDPSLLPIVKEQFPQIQALNVPLPPSEQSFGNGICLNKNNALATRVRQAVAELRSEGKIAELEKKWKLEGR
jgi:ABC-type amino acid transport substrate-binding protein